MLAYPIGKQVEISTPQLEFRYRTGFGQAKLDQHNPYSVSEHPSDYGFVEKVRPGIGKIAISHENKFYVINCCEKTT